MRTNEDPVPDRPDWMMPLDEIADTVLAYMPKPLPPGGLVPACASCGHQLRDISGPVASILEGPPCSECGSRLRVWERRPANWLDNLRYRWRLRRWRCDSKEMGEPVPANPSAGVGSEAAAGAGAPRMKDLRDSPFVAFREVMSIEEVKRRFPACESLRTAPVHVGFETREPDVFGLLDAINLAAKAHCGQLDKGGEPYLWHVLRVGFSLLPDTDAAVLGILHDVREDSDISEEEIQLALGGRQDLYAILGTLTRGEKQPYEEYIRNIAFAPYIATRVKLADLRDNLDPRRLDKLGEKCGSDLMYTLKCRYREAFRLLSGAIESGCAK